MQVGERDTQCAARLVNVEGGGVRGENARGNVLATAVSVVTTALFLVGVTARNMLNWDEASIIRGGLAGGDTGRLAGETLQEVASIARVVLVSFW